MRQAQQLGPQDQLEISSSLLGVKNLGGRDVAEIETITSLRKRQGEMEMQTDMKGVSLVDLASGNVLQAEITGTSAMRGGRQMQDYTGRSKTVRMDSQGSSHMSLLVTPQSDSTTNALPTRSPGPPSNPVVGSLSLCISRAQRAARRPLSSNEHHDKHPALHPRMVRAVRLFAAIVLRANAAGDPRRGGAECRYRP